MVGERSASSRWTRLFGGKELAGEDFFSRFLSSLSRIFEGADEEETFRQVRSELIQAFDCEDLSLFVHDPEDRPGPEEGDWVLTVKTGFGEGERVTQAHAQALPDLQPGRPVPFDEDLAKKAALKVVAMAFDEDAFYGCDIERKIVLIKDPKPEDDLGSGDLSVLAIPLRFHNRVGRVTERTRVGVLVLYRTPVRRELGELEGTLRSVLAYALVAPGAMLKDPITGLFTQTYLREELSRHLGLFALTEGKLRGGLVVGTIDTLTLYKQTLETQANLDPGVVGQKVSDVLRGVASCLWKRASNHDLGGSEHYKSGFPGRIGKEGFGVVLPLMQENELYMWAIRLSQDVVSYRFESEDLLVTGDITVSLRVIPFAKGTPAELWKLATKALREIGQEQQQARRDPGALAKAVKTIKIFQRGRWLTSREYASELGL